MEVKRIISHNTLQCFGSVSFWCGSGSADPLPGWWIRIRGRFLIRILFFSVQGVKLITMFFVVVVILSLLFAYIKLNKWLKKNYIFIILVDSYASLSLFFFCTRIQINVSWYGSGSGSWPMIRIRPDPDPKHWYPVWVVILRLWTLGANLL